MSTFEWAIVTLIFLGLVVPVWAIIIIGLLNRRRAEDKIPGTRYRAYMAVLDRLVQEAKSEASNGPAVVASMRELRSFPEYRDISVLLLNATNITGKGQYDRMLEVEVQQTEAFLLESAAD